MSRPPRPQYRISTTADPAESRERFDYLDLEFADFVRLQEELAAEEAHLATTGGEGDFAKTLMELSALLGHTLGLYQDLYAREAYLGTAQSARSLVRHARRLAYEPDAGLAATGYVALTIGNDLSGTIPAGFALASTPQGEVKAQDYETLEDVDVDARRNKAWPTEALHAIEIGFDSQGRATFQVKGTGWGLDRGDPVLLVGPNNCWLALTVEDSSEDPAHAITTVKVTGAPAGTLPITLDPAEPKEGFRLLAKPKAQLHLFGWNAPSQQFPPSELKQDQPYPHQSSDEVTDVTYGYTVQTEESGGGYCVDDVYLSLEAEDALSHTFVLGVHDTGPAVFHVLAEKKASVAFVRGASVSLPVTTFTDGTPQSSTETLPVETSISGTVTAIQVERSIKTADDTAYTTTGVKRTELRVQPSWLAHWQVETLLVGSEPNPSLLTQPVKLDGDFEGLRPGRVVAFTTLEGSVAQVVEVQKLQTEGEETLLWWEALTTLPENHSWILGNLKVLGNVAPISHGKSVEEILGDSDGVTPFLRFTLKKSPVTMLPGAEGSEPDLEVRVNDVRWDRVEDFHGSRPEDRHYRLEFDEERKATIVFGDGRQGAIPSSGKKHIRARYRTGNGVLGNAEARHVSRIQKANPLVRSAVNLTAVRGGADAAAAGDIRRQATRYIRTFDRAVSVSDYADLALLFPGVVRAAARWEDGAGVLLVAATAEGVAPQDKKAFRQFLDGRRDTEVPLTLQDPQPVDVYVTLTVEHDPNYLSENVKKAVQDALFGEDEEAPGLFTFAAREFGQAEYLSRLYETVASVAGVLSVTVSRFSLSTAEDVMDVIQVTSRQWLRLAEAVIQAAKRVDQ